MKQSKLTEAMFDQYLAENTDSAVDEDKELSIEATDIFFRNQKSKAQIVINRGGAGSSKSYSLCQLMLYKFFTEEKKKILILRKALPSLRLSCYSVMNQLANEYGVRDKIIEEKVHMNWYFNGSMIHFGSVDDPEKLKCFHPDTEVLTRHGFKNIKDVVVGELVATMNPVTRETCYKPVSKTFAYDYEGDMIEPSSCSGERSTSLKFSVTPNHKMLAIKDNGVPYLEEMQKLVVKESGHLKNGVKFARYNKTFAEGKIIDTYEIPKREVDSRKKKGRKTTIFPIVPFLKFLGWFLSEGTATPGAFGIHIAQSKEAGRIMLEEDLKDFPYTYSKDDIGYKIYGKDLNAYLCSLGRGSYHKRIPRDIMELHPSLLIHLFNALIAGDGMWWPDQGKGEGYKWTYTTSSKQLADDVSELGFKLGYSISGNTSKTVKGNISWVVRGFKGKDSGFNKVKCVPYNGKVYCVEVPPYNTLVTRYAQVIVITGNSSDWNYIWFEEATEFSMGDFNTLRLRLRAKSKDGKRNQIFLSFNPIDEFHWIKTKVIDDPSYEVEEIISTYKDNPYIMDDIDYIQTLENLQYQDIGFYNVYALGQWGKLENVIYSNWDNVDWVPDEASVDYVCYGLDFGYNDPTSLNKYYVKKKEVWCDEKLYHSKLTNGDLITKLQDIIPVEKRKSHVIYADSAEPDRIQEIKTAGFNVKPALKQINPGIDYCKQLKIHVLATSINTVKELRAYSWRKDKDGNATDEPIDFMNHAMDEMRYALYTSKKKSAGLTIRLL